MDLIAVSRGPALAGRWVAADVAAEAGPAAAVEAVGPRPLDALLDLGGTWERGAFTDAYSVTASDAEETRRVLAVNLTAPVELARRLAPALRRAENPRIVLIGALSGLPGRASPEVANTAAKAGLQGAAAALRAGFGPQGIGGMVLNPGNVATPEVLDDIAAGRFGAQAPIPMADLLAVRDLVLALSPDADLTEISQEQRRPG